jgi:hypothetical protein
MYSTRCAQDTARDAVQVFGGRGITQTGMGRFIEHVGFISPAHCVVVAELSFFVGAQYHRTITFDAILGGGMAI